MLSLVPLKSNASGFGWNSFIIPPMLIMGSNRGLARKKPRGLYVICCIYQYYDADSSSISIKLLVYLISPFKTPLKYSCL